MESLAIKQMLPNVRAITLAETPDKTRGIVDHLNDQQVNHRLVRGINARKWGLATVNPYQLDGLEHDSIIDPKHVGLHLSHYFCWMLMDHAGYEEMTVLEDDCRFEPGWKEGYRLARQSLPSDWDILLIGNAHTIHRNKELVRGNVWECWWPIGTNAYVVRKKALPILLSTADYAYAPIDLVLARRSYPRLRVYTCIPRLAIQEGTPLDP